MAPPEDRIGFIVLGGDDAMFVENTNKSAVEEQARERYKGRQFMIIGPIRLSFPSTRAGISQVRQTD